MMKTIADTVAAAGSLKTFCVATRGALLVRTLIGAGPYTLFAPTNRAFDALPEGAFDVFFDDRHRLASVVSYHIAPGRIMARDLMSMNSARTMQGEGLRVSRSGQSIMVNDAHVVQADVQCTNGVIHVIDQVLVPAEVEMAA